jgi:hypothetical protein
MLQDSFGHITSHRLSVQFADKNNKEVRFIFGIFFESAQNQHFSFRFAQKPSPLAATLT